MERESKSSESKSKSNPIPSATDPRFKPHSEAKGIRLGAQFMVKSLTIRRASPVELASLLRLHPPLPPLPSTVAYLPTNFTILAHSAWHTLTLGLGTKNSKALLFVFESEGLKSSLDRILPAAICLGEVNRRMIRGLVGCEMARFKFRKGCLTFYVYGVRRIAPGLIGGFERGEDLRRVLQCVVDLRDFLDHSAMLAMPKQRTIEFEANS